MTKQEFKKLTGVAIDMDQYEVINGMYMCSDKQTKQEFCKCFMEMDLMSHVKYVVRLKERQTKLVMEMTEVNNQCAAWRDRCIEAEDEAVRLQGKVKSITEILKGGEE